MLFSGELQIEIAGHIAPDRVDVVGDIPVWIRLDIAKFDNERWSFDPEEVSTTFVRCSSPAEIDLIDAHCFNQGIVLANDLRADVRKERVQDRNVQSLWCLAYDIGLNTDLDVHLWLSLIRPHSEHLLI